MNNNERIITLMRELLKGPVTTRDIARSTRVSTRTIARDVDRLTKIGVPVFTRPGRGGGLVLALGSQKARAALCKLLDSCEQAGTDESVLRPLARMFRHGVDPRSAESTQADVLRAVHDTLMDRACVHLDYFGLNGRIRRGDYRSSRIVLHNGEWGFTARPATGGAAQPYLVSKVTHVGPCRQTSVPPALNPLPADNVCRRVQFLFPGMMAQQLVDMFCLRVIDETDTGDLLIRPETELDRWQIGYYLASMVPIEVIGPEELQEKAISDAITAYGKVAPRCRVSGFLPLGTVLPDRF